MTIKLSKAQRIKVTNSGDVFRVMQEILLKEQKVDREKEHFWMIGLANNNLIKFIELVSLGSVTATVVEPMNVFRVSVMKGAVKVIMVHNHPSGEMAASDDDKDMTDRLIQVGRILNIKVLDHLIISTTHFMSFANEGLMAELEKSTKWVPAYELIARIRAEEKKIRELAVKLAERKALKKGEQSGIEKGKKEEKIEIARSMKKAKEPIEKIIQYTGLTAAEIKRLN